MVTMTWGVVKDGVVVPDSLVPEGAWVQIWLTDIPTEFPPDLQAEFEAWNKLSAKALETVEQLAQEMERDEAR
jgi:hypothetical protein